MFKLHMPAVRYSEDIDLVQVKAGPIGELIEGIREVINPWLGTPKWKQTLGRVTFRYQFISEDGLPLTLKIEINTREHFSAYGYQKIPLKLNSRWFSGSADILTYEVDELLGTKTRALYQRKKGRDLFDLWFALTKGLPAPDVERVIDSFLQYMEYGEFLISRALFEQNLLEKRLDEKFNADIEPLLIADIHWNFDQAFDFIMETLIARLPGDPWQCRIKG
ncbi:MAG: nucleotidyl transferase AbiEii/AbiGii toxin family protein [Desulfuromonadales bacterium]|nr:nucleotidyl transferase AbiEii/AbiGii toxin family protein [Desulfuromonadales bacterium]